MSISLFKSNIKVHIRDHQEMFYGMKILFFFAVSLTVDEVVRSKKSTNAASSDTVHRPGLQVHKQRPGDVFTTYKQNQ